MITPNDLLSLPKFTAYIKLMVDGMTTDPFSMKTFPLPTSLLDDEIKAKIRKQSRQRYAVPKEQLESLLKVRAQKQFTQSEKVMEQAKALTQSPNRRWDHSFTVSKILLYDQTYEWICKIVV
jgi:hypothetical protein